MKTSVLLCLAAAGCGSSPSFPAARFANAAPVTAVNDRLDVPRTPKGRLFLQNLYHWDAVIQRRAVRAMELPPDRRALGVNALDEVPDSTWFTNRIGVRDMAIEELVTGPLTVDSPELHKPWTVHGTKSGTSDLGFLITDARGMKFMVKFDAHGFPEQETATHVIVDRLLWACGYNVTEDFIVKLDRKDLVLADDAKITDTLGGKTKLTAQALDAALATVDRLPDGGMRGLASRWLDGKTIGGHPSEGVREDDPNDRIPHQHRRDLRGAYAIFEWVDHVDVQESNFVDAWVEDPAIKNRHYVKHYFIDFGKSMGVMATTGTDPRRGHEYVVDLKDMGTALVTAGLTRRDWEERKAPKLRGVGLFEAASYDPGKWKNDYPVYAAFLFADRLDKFWGAKILMRFTRAQLHAIVETGKLSDPAATEYVTDTLVARQRATAKHWFNEVNPLDRFSLTDGQLCFEDLAIKYEFAPALTTSYKATRYDRDGKPLDTVAFQAGAAGSACTAAPLVAQSDGYTMVRIETTRPDFTGATIVHLAREPVSGAPRVIGIWRE
jgi:hypothetical protein